MTADQLIIRLKAGNYHERGYGSVQANFKARHITTIALHRKIAAVYSAQVVEYLRVFGRAPVRLSIAKRSFVIRIDLDGGHFLARFKIADGQTALGSQVCQL